MVSIMMNFCFLSQKKELTEPVFDISATAQSEVDIKIYVDQYVKDCISYQEQEFEIWKAKNIVTPLHDPIKIRNRQKTILWWSFSSFCILLILTIIGFTPYPPVFQKIFFNPTHLQNSIPTMTATCTFIILAIFSVRLYPIKNKTGFMSCIFCIIVLSTITCLGYLLYPPFIPQTISNVPPNSPMFFSFVGLIIGAPIAYAVWTIRDENMAQQIENARKDTNLKDFQRLSEWASGFHLPEDKTITTNKKITKPVEQGIEETVEVTTTSESFSPPKENQQISRRVGAESLQLAAIYQIQDFMRGMYGEQFMKPAFHLLHSIWEGLISPILPPEHLPPNEIQVMNTREILSQMHKKPIIKAINRALIGDHGMVLRLFRNELAGVFLAGISNKNLVEQEIYLAGLDMMGCDLRFSSLRGIQIQGSDLSGCMIDGSFFDDNGSSGKQISNFSNVIFKRSFLDYCNFSFCNMSQCKFEAIEKINETDFSSSKLYLMNLRGVELSNCNFSASALQHANLSSCKFFGCKLISVDLRYVNIIRTNIELSIADKASISSSTVFSLNNSPALHYNSNELFVKWLEAGAVWVNNETGIAVSPQPKQLPPYQ
jgi:uncharacterized protein YjbI with pentapeptide repeats